MNDQSKPAPDITLFHCINAFSDGDVLPVSVEETVNLKTVKMACSSMVKDVFLLRAFESGADAVVVMVCPNGQCRYLEGNLRARKRVDWVKKLLDEIELDGRRLSIYPITAGDIEAADRIIRQVSVGLEELGPNPAKG